MGLKKGTLSFTRFGVFQPLPDNFAVWFDEKIRPFAFRDFFLENEEKSMGWTGLQDVLDTDFTGIPLGIGDYRVYSLRIDKKTIPGALLRLRMLEKQRTLLANRETKRLYREEKDALRETIRREILKRVPPVPSLYDICWSLSKGKVYIFSHTEKVLQDFQDLFRKTFEMNTSLHCPWLDSPSQGINAETAVSHQQGREFLTWLWFKSEERGGKIVMDGRDEIVMAFVRRLVLESGEGDYAESVVCKGQHASLLEAKEALRQGKKIREARLSLEIDSLVWEFTIKADLFQFQAMKLPPSELEDTASELDEEGHLLEHIYLLEKAVEMMDRLFAFYIELRVSEGWNDEVTSMNAWMSR